MGIIPQNLLPTEEGPNGIRFDFNNGCRVMTPEEIDAKYEILLYDRNSGNIVERCELGKGRLWMSKFKYYINYRLEIKANGEQVLVHDMDLKDREVLLYFLSDCIGDSIAWFSYAPRFMRKHSCKLGIRMNPKVAELFRNIYTDIKFFTHEEANSIAPYATYKPCVCYGGNKTMTRMHHWQVPLDALAGYDLGMGDEIRQMPPFTSFHCMTENKENKIIVMPYICFAFRASRKYKEWNFPGGWDAVVAHVKSLGYRAICIDRDGGDIHGAEDFTGDRPLTERAKMLSYAELFVGLPSGLSWLAWCTHTPIVMVSGFTEPYAEMPHRRVQNNQVCHGCWNNPEYALKWNMVKDCPGGRDCECTRSITPQMVINAIDEELGI